MMRTLSNLLVAVLVLALTPLAFSQPVVAKGRVSDKDFWEICRAKCETPDVRTGSFVLLKSNQESPFETDRPETNLPAFTVQRRTVSQLMVECQNYPIDPAKITLQSVAWFAWVDKEKHLHIALNGELGKFENDLLNQVAESGEKWISTICYFVGGPGDRDLSWIVNHDKNDFTEIDFGEAKHSVSWYFDQLKRLKVTN